MTNSLNFGRNSGISNHYLPLDQWSENLKMIWLCLSPSLHHQSQHQSLILDVDPTKESPSLCFDQQILLEHLFAIFSLLALPLAQSVTTILGNHLPLFYVVYIILYLWTPRIVYLLNWVQYGDMIFDLRLLSLPLTLQNKQTQSNPIMSHEYWSPFCGNIYNVLCLRPLFILY